MKYYSEITKKMYDSVDELNSAEKAIAEKNNKRKADAEKIDKAYQQLVAARENYSKTLSDFCSKYGAYHKTIKGTENELSTWSSLGALIDLLNL